MTRCAYIVILVGTAALAGCRKQSAGELSNPKSAAMVFTSALENGDIKTAQRASNASGMETDLLQAMAQSAAGIKRLNTAATAKFGDAAKMIVLAHATTVSSNLVNADVELGDARAIVRSKDGRDSLQLLKIDGAWRVDVGALIRGRDVTNVIPFFRAAGLAASEVADEITAGHINDVNFAREELQDRLVNNIPRLKREQYEASTRPAPPVP
jgi:hypothetical protein